MKRQRGETGKNLRLKLRRHYPGPPGTVHNKQSDLKQASPSMGFCLPSWPVDWLGSQSLLPSPCQPQHSQSHWAWSHHSLNGLFLSFFSVKDLHLWVCWSFAKGQQALPWRKAWFPPDNKSRSWMPGPSLLTLLEFSECPWHSSQHPSKEVHRLCHHGPSGGLQQPLLFQCIIYMSHFHCQGQPTKHTWSHTGNWDLCPLRYVCSPPTTTHNFSEVFHFTGAPH